MGRAARRKRDMTREERMVTVGAPTTPEMVLAAHLDDPQRLTDLVDRLGWDDAATIIGAGHALRVGANVVDPEVPDAELPLAWFGGVPGGTYEIARDGTVRPSGWRSM